MAMRIDDYLNSGSAAQDAMSRRRAQDANTWKTMMSQINNTSWDTMLGYGLGKLLLGAWEHRKRRAAEKEAEARKHRQDVSGRAAANAGLAPVKGVLGNGFDVAGGFQAATGGNNPIAWNAYGEAMRAQQPKAEAPVEAKTTTTEYTFDPNQSSVVQAAQGQSVNRPLNLLEKAAQVQQEAINPNDIWKQFAYGRQG